MKGLEITKKLAVQAERQTIWDYEIRWGPILSIKERLYFYQQLGSLLASRLSLRECLGILEEQANNRRLAPILAEIQKGIARGKSFSEACREQKKVFSAFEIQSIHMGEQSGRLREVLPKIAAYFERKHKLRRKLIQALTYPTTVILIAILVVAFMLGFVVPMFADIFQRFDAELPALTRYIMGLSDALGAYFGYIFPSLLAFGGLIYWMSKQVVYRDIFGRLSLRLPLLGTLLHKLHLARSSYALAMLLEAKVHLDESLALCAQISTLSPLRKAFERTQESIIAGESFYHAISQEAIFPPVFKQMIKVGEQTACLPAMLNKLAQNMEEESEVGLSQLTTFMEPLLIVLIGGLVAIILIAMYLPMFELSNAMSG
ncbi:MAG: type II secretion system F family protein [Bacteroidota bacterium]